MKRLSRLGWNQSGRAKSGKSFDASLDARDAQIVELALDGTSIETLNLIDVNGSLDYETPSFVSITYPFLMPLESPSSPTTECERLLTFLRRTGLGRGGTTSSSTIRAPEMGPRSPIRT